MSYHTDHRVIAADIYKPQYNYKDMTISLLLEDDDGLEETLVLQGRYAICDTCRGKGTHVNPAIDCDGFEPEGPDDMEMYMSGVYDVPCNGCDGSGKILEPDADANKKEDLDRYYSWVRDQWEFANERAQERRMGC